MNIIKKKITVVDSIMGSGKTSWAIQEMKTNASKHYVYITPFLPEVDRIITETAPEKHFVQPENKGDGKLTSLNKHLANKADIASTHELFKHLNGESFEELLQTKYTLILDETLDVVVPYPIKNGDLKLLRDGNWITIDEDGFVEWNSDIPGYDSTFEEVKLLAEKHNLVCVNDTMLVWQYPPEVFALFDEVYILTYLFEASGMCAYLKYHGINYEKKMVTHGDDGYRLSRFRPADASVFSSLISIYHGVLNTNIPQKRSSMSKQWFSKTENIACIKQLKNNIHNYLQHKCHAKQGTIMWTCFQDDVSRLKGKGYSKSHVPCNCRSTNDYSDCFNLVYSVNRYFHPAIPAYFSKRGVKINNDLFALSEMLQWIWRSRIRNGQPVNIYIASDRMRELLEKWLHGELPGTMSQDMAA